MRLFKIVSDASSFICDTTSFIETFADTRALSLGASLTTANTGVSPSAWDEGGRPQRDQAEQDQQEGQAKCQRGPPRSVQVLAVKPGTRHPMKASNSTGVECSPSTLSHKVSMPTDTGQFKILSHRS